jgi:hypothetical protein
MQSGFPGRSLGGLRPSRVVRLRSRCAWLLLAGPLLAAACSQSAEPPPEPAFPTRREAPSPAPPQANVELVTPAEDVLAAPAPTAAPTEAHVGAPAAMAKAPPSAPAQSPAPEAASPGPGRAPGAGGPPATSTMNPVPVGNDRHRDPQRAESRPAQQQQEPMEPRRQRGVPPPRHPPARQPPEEPPPEEPLPEEPLPEEPPVEEEAPPPR